MRVSGGQGAGNVLGAQVEGGGRSRGHGSLQRLNLTVGGERRMCEIHLCVAVTATVEATLEDLIEFSIAASGSERLISNAANSSRTSAAS